jgi:hypothetical protein
LDFAAQEPAVSLDARDRRPGGEDAGQRPALATQPDRQIAAVAQIAHGRDARAQRGMRGRAHLLQRGVVVPARQRADHICT